MIIRTGSYEPLQAADVPDSSSPDYKPTLLFKARGVAQSNPDKALALLSDDDQSPPARTVRSLATYFKSKSAEDNEAKEKALDELRDLCVEIEGDEVDDEIKGIVRATAAAAFVAEGENEEALETLEAGTSTRNLEGYSALASAGS